MRSIGGPRSAAVPLRPASPVAHRSGPVQFRYSYVQVYTYKCTVRVYYTGVVQYCRYCTSTVRVLYEYRYRYGLFGMNLVSAVLTVRKTYGRWYIVSVFFYTNYKTKRTQVKVRDQRIPNIYIITKSSMQKLRKYGGEIMGIKSYIINS